MNEFYRGRRLRRNPVIREMVRETQLSAADLMMLYFVVDTTDEDFKKEIPSMPGQYQLSLKQLEKTVGEAVDAGLRSLMLFGIPSTRTPSPAKPMPRTASCSAPSVCLRRSGRICRL